MNFLGSAPSMSLIFRARSLTGEALDMVLWVTSIFFWWEDKIFGGCFISTFANDSKSLMGEVGNPALRGEFGAPVPD
jgi:hypothetical protein